MTTMEVLDAFNTMTDRSWWHVSPDQGDDAALVMTAAVVMSGMLDECQTQSDLRAAVDHCFALLSGGVLTTMDVSEEVQRIEAELQAWGECMDAKRAAIAESN